MSPLTIAARKGPGTEAIAGLREIRAESLPLAAPPVGEGGDRDCMTLRLESRTAAGASRTGPVQSPRRRGWQIYLIAATCLAPLCTPVGPAQTAIVDVLNLCALAVFALAALAPGTTVRMPLIAPWTAIAIGSLLAMTNANFLKLGALSMAQDVYLYAWFIMVVNLMRDARDLKVIRVAWLWTASGVALWGIVQSLIHGGGSITGLLGSRGWRAPSTLYNPNMLADYLVISLFIVLSMGREVPRLVRWGSCALLGLGLIVTKSNGGVIAVLVGMSAWIVVRAITRRVPVIRFASSIMLILGLAALGAWLHVEWGLGDAQIAALQQHTFVGRMSHSSETRMRIWDQLERSYARSPLGIGPGNSGTITLSVADRQRPDSYLAKEAHSDYLAYAIERGPLALAGLLLITGIAFMQIARYWKRARRLEGHRVDAASWTAAMAAAMVASSMHSTVIEKLHFRHFWLFLAMVCGSTLLAVREAAAARERPGDVRAGDLQHSGAATPVPSTEMRGQLAARRARVA